MPDLPVHLPRRLDKHLRDGTGLSLLHARRAIAAGRVTVTTPTGPVREVADDAIVFEDDDVRLDGAEVRPRRDAAYVVLNKPKGITCTTHDPDGQGHLGPFLEPMGPGVFPVGRLDRDTTGLLLCTSDADLVGAVLRPERGVDKEYWLWIDGVVEDGDPRLGALLSGVQIPDGMARAERVVVEARSDHFTELAVTLHMGLNRQLRKTCYALQLHLVHLHRRRIGPLRVAGLGLGEHRHLAADEVEALWAAVGGREPVLRRRVASLAAQAAKARAKGHPWPRLEAWLEARGIRLADQGCGTTSTST